MRNIVDRNQKNFDDAVRWIHGTVKIVSTDSYKDKGNRVMEQTMEIWYDGSHSRTDILESKFIGKETDPVVLEEYSNGGQKIIKPLDIGHTEIESIESQMIYRPSMRAAYITSPKHKQEVGRCIRSVNLVHYQTISGWTIKEIALGRAKGDDYSTVKRETVDGEDCLLLENYYAEDDITRKIWIVPSKGYCIKKTQFIHKGTVQDEYTTTLKEYLPGIWWFDSVKGTIWGNSTVTTSDKTWEISVESLTINESIDPKTFTLAGTNVPYGTRVQDEISGLSYVYGTSYEPSQQDVDLALASIEDSMERPIKETADLTDKPSQKVSSKSKASAEDMEKKDPDLTRNAQVEKTNRGFLLSVGLGSGLVLSVIAVSLIKINKKKGK
jgi:hypothetical protein